MHITYNWLGDEIIIVIRVPSQLEIYHKQRRYTKITIYKQAVFSRYKQFFTQKVILS